MLLMRNAVNELVADEECYKRAVDFPLSPSLPETRFHETYDESLFQRKCALRDDILS